MPRPDANLSKTVIQRANGRCEYCQFPQFAAELPFHIDHVIAEKHGGKTEESNLAWACFSCNMHKGPNIAGVDPLTGRLTRLFHPRQDLWDRHFSWDRAVLTGLTDIGRTTVNVLCINEEDSLANRIAMNGGLPDRY